MDAIPHGSLGLVLALGVGLVLGLLGGGGSILALPIFLYVFAIPPKPAIAMSLAVVGASAFIGFLGHWRQGTVSLRVALPFGACAMAGAFVAARLARHVPAQLQLALFAGFAATAALLMLRDAARSPRPAAVGAGGVPERVPERVPEEAHFSLVLAAQGVGVGVLTAIIGAGGGFVIVPALVLLAGLPVRAAVGSSLLIIAMNALSGFVGYIGQVPIAWALVVQFTLVASAGVVIGTRLVPHVPQARLKQGFAVMILVLGTYLVLRALR